jgi:hypothetical protein
MASEPRSLLRLAVLIVAGLVVLGIIVLIALVLGAGGTIHNGIH